MRSAIEAVKCFHTKYGFPLLIGFEAVEGLSTTANILAELANRMNPDTSMPIARAHLVLEETAELLAAMAAGDRLAALDALADLVYVVIGTAVAFDLPLAEAFVEVHKSNMTKTIARDRPGHPGKGDGYQPPNLADLLTMH